MKNPLPSIARVVPVLMGPAVMLLPTESAAAFDFIGRFLYFFLLFGCVGILKSLLIAMYGGESAERTPNSAERVGPYRRRKLVSRRRDILEVGLLIVLALALVGLLQAFKAMSPPEAFTLGLAAIFFGSVELRLAALRWPISAALARLVAATAVSYLSLFLSSGAWLWQTFGFALACGCLGAALSLAGSIETLAEAPVRKRKILSRLTILTTVSCPALCGILVQLGEVGSGYLLVFALIPALASTFNHLNSYEKDGAIPPRLLNSMAAGNLLFIVIIAGVGIVYRA